jgi:isopentenyl-diphosphate delta-isomerase
MGIVAICSVVCQRINNFFPSLFYDIKAFHFTGKCLMTATEHVILVDEYDNPIGTAEKLEAHRESLCHRAFSVFILRNSNGLEVLLQQRAKHKYHSPLLWTNTCCSHPRPGEEVIAAGQRRLKEEMGLEIALKSLGSFHYIAHFDNGLTENEVDHVLVGYWNQEPIMPNPNLLIALLENLSF